MVVVVVVGMECTFIYFCIKHNSTHRQKEVQTE